MPEAGTPGMSSSRPFAEWKTTARSDPRVTSASARSRTSSGRPTPIIWRVAPAGFARGPKELKIVRTPSSRRHRAELLHRRMKRGREQEHEADLVEQPARAVRVEVDRDS